MKSEQKYILIWAFIALVLFIWVFNWIQKEGRYIIKESFIGYQYNDTGTPNTNHTVDLPINNTLDCQNMCSPLARCYKTGQQCSSDIDCPGCNPHDPNEEYKPQYLKDYVGYNDAGKLSYYTPQFSTLTTDIGTRAKLIGDKLAPPPQYDIGVNIWRDTFDEGQKLFDKRYYSGSLPYTPVYPKRMSLSGEFVENGPLAENAFL
uniref:Uncharacterized protein n=1 Tax=viral metagenome TaxID=1070528 RepID=A0A6C0KW18_9ZZZZ